MKKFILYHATYVNPDDELNGTYCSACWIDRGRCAVRFPGRGWLHHNGVILYAFPASHVRLTLNYAHTLEVGLP